MNSKINNESIAKNLRKIREIRGFKQETVANKLGLTPNGYGKIERGETSLSIDRLNQIAEVFGVEMNDILHLDERVVYNIQNMRNSAPHGTVNNYNLTQEDLTEIQTEMDELHKLMEHQNALLVEFTSKLKNKL